MIKDLQQYMSHYKLSNTNIFFLRIFWPCDKDIASLQPFILAGNDPEKPLITPLGFLGKIAGGECNLG